MHPFPWLHEMPTIAELTQTSFQDNPRAETASVSVMADIQPPSPDKATVDKSVDCDYKPSAHSKTTSYDDFAKDVEEEVREEYIQKTERPVQTQQAILPTHSNQQQITHYPSFQPLCYCPTAHHQYQTQCPCGKFHAAIITNIETPDCCGYETSPYRCK